MADVWLVRGRIIGATVTHLCSLVIYFHVSVVDQVLVFEPREPPVRQTGALCQKSDTVMHSSKEKLRCFTQNYFTLHLNVFKCCMNLTNL